MPRNRSVLMLGASLFLLVLVAGACSQSGTNVEAMSEPEATSAPTADEIVDQESPGSVEAPYTQSEVPPTESAAAEDAAPAAGTGGQDSAGDPPPEQGAGPPPGEGAGPATETGGPTTPLDQNSPCLTAVQNASIDCETDSDHNVIESNGLPTDAMMVGISDGGWNGQWPEPQDYTGDNAFFVPKQVELVSDPPTSVMNTAGVTANGIPFFFPYAPGNGQGADCALVTDEGECLRDAVAAGEMDECGGHTGRGNDYHYHDTPTCLIQDLEDGTVVGYMLDGLPIYANPLPGSTAFESCGGYVSPEGIVHYAFQDGFPYLTACMLGQFTEGPRTGGSEVYTGDQDTRATGSITGFTEDDNGCHVMTFSTGQELTYCH